MFHAIDLLLNQRASALIPGFRVRTFKVFLTHNLWASSILFRTSSRSSMSRGSSPDETRLYQSVSFQTLAGEVETSFRSVLANITPNALTIDRARKPHHWSELYTSLSIGVLFDWPKQHCALHSARSRRLEIPKKTTSCHESAAEPRFLKDFPSSCGASPGPVAIPNGVGGPTDFSTPAPPPPCSFVEELIGHRIFRPHHQSQMLHLRLYKERSGTRRSCILTSVKY